MKRSRMKRKPRVKEGMVKGRWKSDSWKEFVRQLPCACHDPRCGNCNGKGPFTDVIAAHLRTAYTGMGARPDDFLVYPLSDGIHKIFHATEQPGVAWQLERVTDALRAGFSQGVLSIDPNAETTIEW